MRPQQSLGQTLAALYGAQPVQAGWIRQRLQRLNTSESGSDGWSDTAVERALLLQASGREDEAVTALQQAVDDGFRDVAWLRATPLFVPLHGAPGWPALLERIDADIARQRAQVLAAAWRPDDLATLSAAPAAGTR